MRASPASERVGGAATTLGREVVEGAAGAIEEVWRGDNNSSRKIGGGETIQEGLARV